MKYFFEEEKKQRELKDVLDSWLGTPFRHMAGVKKLGCDCVHFVATAMEEVGAGPKKGNKYQISPYPKDWHIHHDEELLMKGIVEQMAVERESLDRPKNGDMFLFKYGRACSHIAIYFDDRFYQSVAGRKLIASPWMERPWHHRKRYNFRMVEK